MTKRKITAIISTLIYLAEFLAGIIAAVTMLYIMNTDEQEGIGAAALALVAIIVAIIGFIYSAATIFPIIFRAISIKKAKCALIGLCIPFDLAYIAAGAMILINGINEPELITVIIGIAAIIVALTANVCNAIGIKATRAEAKVTSEDGGLYGDN